jgi:hypothetical protein
MDVARKLIIFCSNMKFRFNVMFLRLQNAVCCEDHLHCCPSGYTCDVKDGRCNKGDVSLPFYQKISAKLVKKIETKESIKASSVVCPDGASFCPKDYTCCKMVDGSYGCWYFLLLTIFIILF